MQKSNNQDHIPWNEEAVLAKNMSQLDIDLLAATQIFSFRLHKRHVSSGRLLESSYSEESRAPLPPSFSVPAETWKFFYSRKKIWRQRYGVGDLDNKMEA